MSFSWLSDVSIFFCLKCRCIAYCQEYGARFRNESLKVMEEDRELFRRQDSGQRDEEIGQVKGGKTDRHRNVSFLSLILRTALIDASTMYEMYLVVFFRNE